MARSLATGQAVDLDEQVVELLLKQIESADLIMVNKADLASDHPNPNPNPNPTLNPTPTPTPNTNRHPNTKPNLTLTPAEKTTTRM